jgi:hypothetical protein
VRLGFWQKAAIYVTTIMVGLSGVLWFILHDVVADDLDDWAHLLLILHGVSAYALLVAIGSLLPVHVRSGWLRRRNLATGLTVIAVMAVLGITALMLYYGDEDMQKPAKWLHLAFGLGCFIVFPAHAFLRVKQRETARRATVGQSAADLSTEPTGERPIPWRTHEYSGAELIGLYSEHPTFESDGRLRNSSVPRAGDVHQALLQIKVQSPLPSW